MARSKHADVFNHDEDAADYDHDVLNESDPIRNGYDALLDWVVNRAGIRSSDRVIDLGIGSGNLAARLPLGRSLTGVDISTEMLALARAKVTGVSLVQADLLEWSARAPNFDVLVSTYAVHHLEAAEKKLLFEQLAARAGGPVRLIFGDLGFADEQHRAEVLQAWQETGKQSLLDAVDEEFFWDFGESSSLLTSLGFQVELEQFGELSWGLAAARGA